MSDRDEMNLAALHDRRLHEGEIALAKQRADRVSGMPVIRRFEGPACPNGCKGVARSGDSEWRCHTCKVNAVQVEYVVLRAADYEGAVAALRALADEVDRLRGPRADPLWVLDAPMTLALARARGALGGQS